VFARPKALVLTAVTLASRIPDTALCPRVSVLCCLCRQRPCAGRPPVQTPVPKDINLSKSCQESSPYRPSHSVRRKAYAGGWGGGEQRRWDCTGSRLKRLNKTAEISLRMIVNLTDIWTRTLTNLLPKRNLNDILPFPSYFGRDYVTWLRFPRPLVAVSTGQLGICWMSGRGLSKSCGFPGQWFGVRLWTTSVITFSVTKFGSVKTQWDTIFIIHEFAWRTYSALTASPDPKFEPRDFRTKCGLLQDIKPTWCISVRE
jgi:hypothetical protein